MKERSSKYIMAKTVSKLFKFDNYLVGYFIAKFMHQMKLK